MKPVKNSLLGSLLDTEPQGGVVFRTLVEQLAGPPPRDAEREAERTKLVDAELDRLKQQDEAFKKAIVARMEKDEDFRRWIHAEAESLGENKRGGLAQNQASVRAIVRNLTLGGLKPPQIKKVLKKTLGGSTKQAKRRYDKELAAQNPTIPPTEPRK